MDSKLADSSLYTLELLQKIHSRPILAIMARNLAVIAALKAGYCDELDQWKAAYRLHQRVSLISFFADFCKQDYYEFQPMRLL